MSQNKTQTTPKQTAPPAPPMNKHFDVGATNAFIEPHANNTVTLRLKRTIRASPEKIYQAFLDPDSLAAWLPPHGMVARTHSLEPKVGGKFRMSFYTVNKSWTSSFGGTYIELIPNKKIVHTDQFESDDPNMQGTMKITISLTPVAEGTLVEVVQEGIPAPVAGGSPYGWSQSFEKLAQLVEPELPF